MKTELPLDGFQVLDLTTTIYGPYTSQILGDFGADIIKIESPEGDPVRNVGPSRSPGMGALFLGVNRNKRSVVLNLKQKIHREALWGLIKKAQIFVHNMRASKISTLGFSPEKVLKTNPKIIYAGLHGYGEAGPYRDRPAYDDVIQGEAGTASLFDERDGEPALIPSLAVDKGVACMAANAILAALIKLQRTGKGAYVEVPMYEAAVSFNLVEHQYGATFIPPLSGYGYPRMLSSFRRPHRTLDGYLCILAYTDKQWSNFWNLTTRPDFQFDPRFKTMTARSKNIDQLYTELSKELNLRTTSDWLNLFKENDVPAGPIKSLSDIRKDPHLNSIGFFRPFEHKTEGKMELPDTPFRFDRKGLPIRRGQPKLGADTEAVLHDAGIEKILIKQILTDLGKKAPKKT